MQLETNRCDLWPTIESQNASFYVTKSYLDQS